MAKKSFIIAVISSLLIVAMVFLINFITSFSYPWFIYPAFAVLWWPMSVYFAGNRKYILFSITASVLVSVFFLLVNMINSFAYPWFVFPVFLIWWWPLIMLTVARKKNRIFSIIASIYTIVFFFVVNLVSSPNTVWFIYPAFAVLWWPASMFLARKSPKAYSVVMSLLTIGFLLLINLLYAPKVLWFHQTIFFILCWPVVTLLGEKAKTLDFSIIAAALIAGYFILLYYLQTPDAHLWYLYTLYPVVWWPVCVGFKKHIMKPSFLIISMVLFIIYYGALNLFVSPCCFWMIYLIYPALWAAMGMYFGPRKMYLGFSVSAAVVTIIFFAVVNYMTSPGTVWAVYPGFAIIWWPLSMIFFKKDRNKQALN